MKKEELQQQAELVINPINVVTKMDFKLISINSKTTLWFNRGNDDSDEDNTSYYYFAEIKSHGIGVSYYPNDPYRSQYKCIHWKNSGNGGKGVENFFDTEIELLVFLKQSKFKLK